MLKTDPIAKKLLEQWKIPMPDQNLTDQEVKQYIAYFKWADEHIQPKRQDAASTGRARCCAAAFTDEVRSAALWRAQEPQGLEVANDAATLLWLGRTSMKEPAFARLEEGKNGRT